MKKLIILAVAALIMVACNSKQETNNTDNMKQKLTLTQEWDNLQKTFETGKRMAESIM